MASTSDLIGGISFFDRPRDWCDCCIAFANALRSLAEDAKAVEAEAAMMATASGLAFMVMMDK